MAKRRFLTLALLAVAALIGCTTAISAGPEVRRISVGDLQARLGGPDLIVLDLRSPADWAGSPLKIRGAVRENPAKLDWVGNYPRDKTIVLYCT
jgi:rhodanese-related sulfurtransferase